MSRVNREELKQLKVGENYTYKQMCNMKIFDKYYSGGTSKKAQIEEFDQYVTYNKLPRGVFEVTEIKLDIEIQEKTSGRKSIYAESLKPQVIFALSEQIKEDGTGTILLNKKVFFKQLGLIGEDFSHYNTHRNELKEKEGIPYEIQNSFFTGTTNKCESAVKSALKQLRLEALADFTENITIVKPLFQELRTATETERKKILKIEKDIFKSMGRKDIRDIYIHNEMDKFFNRISPIIKKELKIDFYFKGYEITPSDEFAETLLSIREINALRHEANKLMKKSIDKSSEKARAKAIKRIEELEQKAKTTLGRLKAEERKELNNLYVAWGNDNYLDFIEKLKEKCMSLKELNSNT